MPIKSCVFLGLLTLSVPLWAINVTVNSGPGVTFLDSGMVKGDFSGPFTSGDFAAAQGGAAAIIQTSTPFWPASLPSGPAAVWIGTNGAASMCGAGTGCPGGGDTALYAVPFTLPNCAATGASLVLYYMVDNQLGSNDPGIYINGIPLSNSTGIGGFSFQQTYTSSDIGSLLYSGTNWLYIDAVNLNGPGGIIF